MCHIQHRQQHKVFKGIATVGKASTGWFFGLKLHLVINHQSEIVHFAFTTGEVADNNKDLLINLLQELNGKLFSDKGYLTTLWKTFYQQGLIIIKVKNMKNKFMELQERLLLRKRPIMETIFGELTTTLDPTTHRKPAHAVLHWLATLVAYQGCSKKPNVDIANL